MVTENTHPKHSLRSAFQQFELWFRFAFFAARRYLWVMIIAIAAGGGLGLWRSLGTTNQYEAQATFLLPLDQVQSEFERLESRHLVQEAIGKFSISRKIDRGSRGRYEMYTESPFMIAPIVLPENLKNRPLAFKLISDSEYEIALPTDEGDTLLRGKIGQASTLGALVLRVDLMPQVASWAFEAKYFVQFNSLSETVDRFLNRLRVIHLADHPNRITLLYADDHPTLALDKLSAFTEAYLRSHEFKRTQGYRERLQEVDAERRVLEAQLMSIPDLQPLLRNMIASSSRLTIGDSSMGELIQAHLDVQMLKARIVNWEAFLGGTITLTELQNQLARWPRQPYDSIFTQSVALGEAQAQFLPTVEMLASRDREALGRRQHANDDANAAFLASTSFLRDWESSWAKLQHDPNSFEVVLRDKYLENLSESSRLQLELRKQQAGPELIDPPYPVAAKGRGLRVKVLIEMMALMLGFAWAVAIAVTYRKRRFQAEVHYRLVAGEGAQGLVRFAADALARRKNAVNMELALEQGHQRIGIVGESGAAAALAADLGAQLAGFGRRVAIVNATIPAPSHNCDVVQLPQDFTAGWWFSGAASAYFQDLAAKYDRLLICLPPPSLEPEVMAMLEQCHLLFYILQRNQNSQSDWWEWNNTLQQLDTNAIPVWMD